MNRERGMKTLDCAACGKPTRAGAEAARVLCDACAAAGREFSRARQLELFASQDVEEVRRKIQAGVDQLDRGEGIDGETVLAELKESSDALRKEGRAGAS